MVDAALAIQLFAEMLKTSIGFIFAWNIAGLIARTFIRAATTGKIEIQ